MQLVWVLTEKMGEGGGEGRFVGVYMVRSSYGSRSTNGRRGLDGGGEYVCTIVHYTRDLNKRPISKYVIGCKIVDNYTVVSS